MSKCSLCLSSDYAERRLCSLCGETLCEECNPPQSDPCVECIWVDGPDSEAARAGRRESPGCHAWYACDDASVSVRPRGGLVRVATSLNPADLDPGQAEDLARHLQACAAWLRAQKDGGR